MKKGLPSPELLRKLLRYEPETGKLFWLNRTPEMFSDGAYSSVRCCTAWNNRYAGKEAFTATLSHGYKSGSIFNQMFSAHRVIWAIFYGSWPRGHIDHISGNVLDNRILNLRDVSNKENMRNRTLQVNNKSGVNGVHWFKPSNKWRAQINCGKRKRHLGLFDEKEKAIEAVYAARIEFGYHENHGRPK